MTMTDKRFAEIVLAVTNRPDMGYPAKVNLIRDLAVQEINEAAKTKAKKKEQSKPIDIDELIKYYNEGYTSVQLAEKFDCSQKRISTALANMCLSARKVDLGRVRALKKAGWTECDILTDIKCTKERLERALKDAS